MSKKSKRYIWIVIKKADADDSFFSLKDKSIAWYSRKAARGAKKRIEKTHNMDCKVVKAEVFGKG